MRLPLGDLLDRELRQNWDHLTFREKLRRAFTGYADMKPAQIADRVNRRLATNFSPRQVARRARRIGLDTRRDPGPGVKFNERIWRRGRGTKNDPARAEPLQLRANDRNRIQKLLRDNAMTVAVHKRCKILLAAANGETPWRISKCLGVSRPTVYLWLTRYLKFGLNSLFEHPHGRGGTKPIPARLKQAIWLRLSAPTNEPNSHWKIARELGVGRSTVFRLSKQKPVKPSETKPIQIAG